MSSGMPELGSKISLISKADIRYEGRLFTVDPQECTIALASVRSFGTEDRETQYPVAPQNQVYDYILFRGTDIKDIRVVNNVPALPNDPAIMQLSVPPSLGPPVGGVPYQQPQFSHPVVGPTQYQTYHPAVGLPPALRSNPVNTINPMAKQTSSMLEMIGGGSRSDTPLTGNIQRKSPTSDQSTQAGSHNAHHPQKGNNTNQGPGAGKGHHEPRNDMRQQHHHHSDQHRPNANGRPRSQNKNAIHQNQQQHHQQNQSHQQQNQNQHPQNNQGMRQGQGQGQGQNQGQGQGQGQSQGQGQGQPQGHGQNQGQNWNRGGGRGGRGGRGRGGFTGRPQGQPGPGGVRPKNTLKFDNDYDFEQANTEFEELRNQLAKVKIAEGEAPPKPELVEAEKKDDSGNETGAGEPEPEDDNPENVNCYDKTKSFFDNISCEAVERSKGRSQRTDWRTERKLNSETFGVATARRGGYRGRGGYFGGQGQMMQGGGGGGGWRGGMSWRGRGGGGRMPHPNSHHHRQQRHTAHHNMQHNMQQPPVSNAVPVAIPVAGK